MDLKLSDKVALVLAASKGLGKAIATLLAEEGAKVIIASRNAEELQQTANEINNQIGTIRVHSKSTDVSKPEDLEQLIQLISTDFGQLDILVNNAGGPPFNTFENFSDEDWYKAFEMNLLSVSRTSKLALPLLKKSESGRIINIISGSVKSVLDRSILSTSMRLGVVGMAKLMADEFGPYNITVNNVCPGTILTDRIKHTLNPDVDTDVALAEKSKNIPLRRIGKPEEFAAVVAFLASEKASYVSGTTIQVDGGAGRNVL
ncbi:SDR family oxidoreductase [Pedobacter sp. AW1-32]|uniref:SDR family oxidoreductase n=1 Tax=Pedobacter sp. AW1-32 TaxID=3383026 RepID=UPI003FF156FF